MFFVPVLCFLCFLAAARPLRHFTADDNFHALASDRNATDGVRLEAESCSDAKDAKACTALNECWWCQERGNASVRI